jgi:prevent-host-death family protein
MTRTISSNEAKQRWGAVISAVSDEGDEVIVESHGKPKVAVISYAEFERFRALREQQRRAELMERLGALEARQMARNAELTDEQVEELANRAAHEAFDDLAAEGKLTFKRDRQSQ